MTIMYQGSGEYELTTTHQTITLSEGEWSELVDAYKIDGSNATRAELISRNEILAEKNEELVDTLNGLGEQVEELQDSFKTMINDVQGFFDNHFTIDEDAPINFGNDFEDLIELLKATEDGLDAS